MTAGGMSSAGSGGRGVMSRGGTAGSTTRAGSAGQDESGGSAGTAPRGGSAGQDESGGSAGTTPRGGSAGQGESGGSAGTLPRGGSAGRDESGGSAGTAPRGGSAGSSTGGGSGGTPPSGGAAGTSQGGGTGGTEGCRVPGKICTCANGQTGEAACLVDGGEYQPCVCLCGDGNLDEGEECDDGNVRSGDGCQANCTYTPSVCGNGVVERGETCDLNCPTSCDDDGDACTADVLSGTVSGCNAACSPEAISECGPGEGCCPPICTPNNDSDCNVCATGNPQGICPTGRFCSSGSCQDGTSLFSQSNAAEFAANTFAGTVVVKDTVNVSITPVRLGGSGACDGETVCEFTIGGLPHPLPGNLPALHLGLGMQHTTNGCYGLGIDDLAISFDGLTLDHLNDDSTAVCSCNRATGIFTLTPAMTNDGKVTVLIQGHEADGFSDESLWICDGVDWTLSYSAQTTGSVTSDAIHLPTGATVGTLMVDADAGVLVQFLDATGTFIPDTELPGNEAGFSPGTVSLTLSEADYPAVFIRALLSGGQELRHWELFSE